MDIDGVEKADRSPPTDNLRSAIFARPLLPLSIAFVVGISFVRKGSYANPAPFVLLAAALLAASLLFRTLRRRKSKVFEACFLFLIFFGLGALATTLSLPELPAPPSLTPFFEQPQTLFLAEVMAPPEFYPDKARIPLRLRLAITEDKTVPVDGGVLLTVGKPPGAPGVWLLGDKLLARLTLKRFRDFNNPGGFEYVRSQAEKGLHARAFVEDERMLVKVSSSSESSFQALVGKRLELFRQRALFWIRNRLDSDSAGFYGALLLGYRVPKEWMDHLNRVGMTHLVSISGFHLALVSMSVFWIACRLARLLSPSLLMRATDRHIGVWAALGAAVLYSLVSGLALPTWRSLIMLALFSGALYWCRRPDALSALSAAALGILLLSPESLWAVSFQLSFGAMLGLFVIYPRLRRIQDGLWEKMPEKGRLARLLLRPFDDAFWVSVAANAAVLPLVAHYFHGVSAAGLVANAVLAPVVGLLVLPLGLVGIALFSVNELIALPFLKVGGWLLGCCEEAIVWFSGLSWAYFWVGAVSEAWLAVFYASLGLLLSRCRLSVKASCLAVMALVCWVVSFPKAVCFSDSCAERTLEVVAIDVGQGSSTLVRFPTGELMLVDGGGFYDDSFDLGRSVLAPFLWRYGIRRLDYVVLSHDHPDHRNGLRFILSCFDVGCFWESGIVDRSTAGAGLASVAAERGISVLKAPGVIGDHAVGRCRVSIIHPNLSYIGGEWDGADLNNVSLVLEIQFGNTRLIIPGDIDQSVERSLFANYAACDQTLLIAPHHGSKGSNSSLLLDRLHPKGVVISCGYDNLFGFPSPRVLDDYRRRKIPCLRTDLDGAVLAVSDGAMWTELRSLRKTQPAKSK